MKLLIIDVENAMLSWAWRAAQAGHEVRWFVKPEALDREEVGNGFKGVEKIDNFVPSLKWADLILVSSNNKYIERLTALKKQGFPVFGPTTESAKLEISRKTGMELLKKVGIEVVPYQTFATMEEAAKHVEKTGQQFVFKTMGDNEDKALTYVSKSAADMLTWIEGKIKQGQKPKGEVMLQEFVKGIEMGVSRFMGSKGFIGPWNESFEYKKMMPGNYGPNCYSADSEVLTKEGWKFWPDVSAEDEICTLKDEQVMYEKPTQLVVGDFEGEMIGWESPYVDILVTPGHNMYVQDDHARKEFWFEPANITESFNRNILRGHEGWIGEDDLSSLPLAQGYLPYPDAELELGLKNFHAWCALIGIYIADGSTRERSIIFGGCPTHKQSIFTQIAHRVGFTAHMSGPDLCVHSKCLRDYCATLGDSNTKRVPQYIKDASPEAIKSFLYGYGAGDGSRRSGNLTFTTVSKGLADDLQELCLKAGYCANIQERDRRGESHLINGYECINKEIAYDIGVSELRLKAGLSHDISYRLPYNGKVFCCTVSSHIIYVRRNGKACFLGQTGEMGTIAYFTKESVLGAETLAKVEKELVAMGHTGDVALGFMIPEDGKPRPTEFTVRWGWPIANMMLASIEGDPIVWMKDALAGKDTTSFKEDIGCCLVLAHGDFPHNKLPVEDFQNLPIYGITKGNKKYLHPQSVKINPMPDMENEKVVRRPVWNTTERYALVVTGFGKDVKQATERTYKTMSQLELANPIVRDDIGEDLKEKLPKLHEMGFATHVNYQT